MLAPFVLLSNTESAKFPKIQMSTFCIALTWLRSWGGRRLKKIYILFALLFGKKRILFLENSVCPNFTQLLTKRMLSKRGEQSWWW